MGTMMEYPMVESLIVGMEIVGVNAVRDVLSEAETVMVMGRIFL